MNEVRSLMTKAVLKIKPDVPIHHAYELMKEHGVRHLPVVDYSGKLVGMLSDRDVQRAINFRQVNELEQELTFNPHDTVEAFMNWPVHTVDESTTLQEITRSMINLKISAFVVSGGNQYIKGIITTDDLLNYLCDLLNQAEATKKIPIQKIFWTQA